MSEERSPETVPDRLVRATIKLLADEGPSAVKARTVAAATGLSTMVVYSHFGGVPELLRAVADHGFNELDRAFAGVPITDDPIADLFTMALTSRSIAHANPHLYDLMFGLSIRATYRPTADAGARPSGRSPAFRSAYVHLHSAAVRLVESGRIRPADPEVVAAALWSYVHGFVTLELAEHFTDFADPLRQVMLPMGITLITGLGADPAAALTSHEAVLARMG